MPEGDSVLQLSERMQWMGGRTVTRSDIRVPRFATEDLVGRQVTQVWPYGKHLFIDVSGRVLHTHLKMEGVWSVHTVGTRWRRPGHTARVVLRFAPQHPGGPEIEVVGHSLGFVRLFDRGEYASVVGHLGPDILAPDWDAPGSWTSSGHGAGAKAVGGRVPEETVPEESVSRRQEALRRILSRPERSIGAALLDQRNVAGIGNEYRAEVCFLAGVDPRRPVGTGADGVDTATSLLDLTRKVMWANRREPRRVFTGDRRPGMGDYVFGRAGRACRRCGTPVAQAFLGGPDSGGDDGELERVIWWCPVCQPE
ncbi:MULTISPECIES: DNA-formamidopyrimidine glycosylase family protein [Corynebacterium]|uniref:DNA-formamidopyrimidine glycosylase family protein n=1 Tax=Corynebacterium TaxID=1716 RepID=UPI000831D103|nr:MULTISPECIES: DNA-formamidopyrimidine glycosylase family protein [Corynebacterium]